MPGVAAPPQRQADPTSLAQTGLCPKDFQDLLKQRLHGGDEREFAAQFFNCMH